VNVKRIGESIPRVLQVASVEMTGQDRELDESTKRILQIESYLYRVYEGPGVAPIDVVVTYSLGNRRGSHPPDVCLEGGGASIVARGALDVPGVAGVGDLPCRSLIVQKGTSADCHLYTYLCGTSYTRSWYYQQIVILWNNLMGRNIGGALIRVSAPVGANDLAGTRRHLSEFMRVFIPYLNEGL
jgi:EpsI family protein